MKHKKEGERGRGDGMARKGLTGEAGAGNLDEAQSRYTHAFGDQD